MKNVGLQLYSIGADTSKDFEGALRMTAEAGFTGVEFAGYFGIDAQTMRNMLDKYGLKAVSSHTNVFGDIDAEIKFLTAVGATQVVCPGAPFENEEGVLKLAEQLNAIGKQFAQGGLRLGYHNHSHEFKKNENGKWLLDVLYDNTDPQYVDMQLDVCWAYVAGADPVAYLTKYRDRVHAVHMKEVLSVSPYQGTAIGEGLVDFKGIYKLLGDEVNYIVEQEGITTMDTWEGLRRSAAYLKAL